MLQLLRELIFRKEPVFVDRRLLWRDRFGRHYDGMGNRVRITR